MYQIILLGLQRDSRGSQLREIFRFYEYFRYRAHQADPKKELSSGSRTGDLENLFHRYIPYLESDYQISLRVSDFSVTVEPQRRLKMLSLRRKRPKTPGNVRGQPKQFSSIKGDLLLFHVTSMACRHRKAQNAKKYIKIVISVKQTHSRKS